MQKKVSYNIKTKIVTGFYLLEQDAPQPYIIIDENIIPSFSETLIVNLENNTLEIKQDFSREKGKKENEVNKAYEEAQYIEIQNGHIFMVQLKGENFLNIERQVFSANIRGFADLITTTIDGNVQVIKNIPKEQWNIFYEKAKDISVNNLSIKTKLLFAIKNVTTQEELDNIKIEFPPIETIILDL